MIRLMDKIREKLLNKDIPESTKINLWKNINGILKETQEKIDELEAFKFHLVGCWVTDKPDIIPKDLIDPYFWEIK